MGEMADITFDREFDDSEQYYGGYSEELTMKINIIGSVHGKGESLGMDHDIKEQTLRDMISEWIAKYGDWESVDVDSITIDGKTFSFSSESA